VVLATEGTYPFGGGGVGTWCHQLCGGLRGFSFTVLAVTGTPHATWQYERLGAVRHVMQVPLWPGEEPATFLTPGPYARTLRRRWRTTSDVVAREFVPPLRTFLREIFEGGRDIDEVLGALVEMGLYLRTYDFKATMRERVVWEAFQEAAQRAQRASSAGAAELALDELTICARWFYNMMLPLAAHIGEADIFHATVAASCALPGIMARAIEGVPFLLTEHGVYLRERYIAVSSSGYADLQKRFLIGLASAVSRACYRTADLVTSVASFNKRWQIPWGAPADRVRVVYNGVDTKRFRPGIAAASPDGRPTLVAAAHVYPLKDVETMIRAVAVARVRVPDVRLHVYGSKSVDPGYVTKCEAIIEELDLSDHVELRGLHPNAAQIFWGADLSVLSSISEGFPYSILEAMASGVPCVATDVGGVREAVGDTGVVVPPRHPEALGTAVADLLLDNDRRRDLARDALDRVVSQFTLQHQLEGYQSIYDELTGVRKDEP
jgi:glycosyltransferase involved in cell wall biosynthesis